MADVNIETKIDMRFFDKLGVTMTKSGRKAMSMSINESLKRGKTEFKRRASKEYAIKQGDVAGTITLKLTSPSSLNRAAMIVKGPRLTVGTSTHFRMTPKGYTSQKGVKVARRKKGTVTIKKGAKKSIAHGFVANPSKIGNTMMWIHKDESIAPLKTISVAQILSNPKMQKEVQKEMYDKFTERFAHHVKRLIGRMT